MAITMGYDNIILQLIGFGKSNGTTGREMAKLRQSSIGAVTGAISRLRRNGVLICASVYNGGYYRPVNDEELQEWLKTEKRRIKTHRAAIKPAMDYLKSKG